MAKATALLVVPAMGFVGLLCALSPSALGQPAQPRLKDGWDAYGYADLVVCRDNPVLLLGHHMDVKVRGGCHYVRVAGSHNDVRVDLAPGGTIEITGAHNDVTWRLPPGAQTGPVLLNHGESNDFHGPGD